MAIKKFSVAREHNGDKYYREHDTREMEAVDATTLVGLGVLLDDGGAKAEAAHKNKMERPPLNKAAPRAKAKG